MKKEIKEYIEKIEKELKELGIEITFKKDGTYSAKGNMNVLNSWKVDRATFLTAKLEGFIDALRILREDK